MALPTINVSLFASGSDAQRSSFAKDLVHALKQHAFVKISHHGLSSEIVNTLFDWHRRFFELPVDVKRKISYKGPPAPSRGYSGLGYEKTSKIAPVSTSLKNLKDVRESLDIGPTSDVEFPNVWLDEVDLPGFRQFIESYYAKCRIVSQHIMQALELGLGIPSGSFAERTTQDSSELRLNNYPQADMRDFQTGSARRIWPHTDTGLITLLLQDSVGGLEFEDRQNPGNFLPITNDDSTDLIVNVADTLERWTNGVLKAGLHHVNTPDSSINDEENSVASRSSIVFFFRANGAASAGPLPHFVTSEDPAKYNEITASEYLRQVNSRVYGN